MLDKLQEMLGNQRLLQILSYVEGIKNQVATVEDYQYDDVMDLVKALIDAQKPSK